MNCPNCRRLVPSFDNFCSYCGAELYPGQSDLVRWIIYAAILIAVLLVGTGILSTLFFRDSVVELAAQVPIVRDWGVLAVDSEETRNLVVTPTPAPSPTPRPTPTPTSAPLPTPTPTLVLTATPTATATPTPVPTATPLPPPTPYPTPTPWPTATTIPSPTPIPPSISALPTSGAPGIGVSIYGKGLKSFVPVSRATIGGLVVTPEPRPSTDVRGETYFSFVVPNLAGGQHSIVVEIDGDTFVTSFMVIAIPTPIPTVTPTPAPTRVPKVLLHARHAAAHYTANVPSTWLGGRVTFFGKPYEGPPGPWVQANTLRGATRYELMPLKEAGVNLVGTYFKERYSSEELCGKKGYVAIRETALLTHYPSSGIALHVDVCEADLHLEVEQGITNEDISNEIIRSLRRQN